jgi:hypothetical protein
MPEMYSFNLSVQRQLTANNIVEIGYVGTMGAHLQANLIAANQLDYRNLPASLNPFTAQGRALLSSNINSAAAQAAGIQKPYASFNGTVAQSLRPFPQILNLDTARGGGDHSGHSTYHSLSARFERRMSAGLTFQAYYLLSKLLTDCDSIANLNTISMDHFNRSLEKSIGQYDQTHNLKINYLWELPFGPGRRFVTHGWGAWLVGGWRLSGIMTYSSGTPVPLGTSVSFPIFNGTNRPTVPTYEGWRAPTKGDDFDPNVDRFLQPASFFGPQPSDRFGNMTRYNPKLRYFPNFTENLSIARRFDFGERVRMDFRWEMFNIFNRAHFGPSSGATTLQSSAFGLWQAQDNEPRRMQVALKLYW